jgi:phosphomannomutase
MEKNMTDITALQNGSDIRGVALPGVPGEEVDLDMDTVSLIARAFVRFLADRTGKAPEDLSVTIGRDPRKSGEALARAFSAGAAHAGTAVTDCGLATTPAMFMSTVFPEFDADGAVMVTASHLPFNRNGLKFFTKEGGVNKEDITEILKTAAALDSGEIHDETKCPGTCESGGGAPDARNEGAAGGASLMDIYSAHLRKLITDGTRSLGKEKPLEGLRIAVDAGNGSGGFFARDVLAPLGADISASRFLDPDGSFPNHIPNPENEEAMASIRDAVLTGGCDLGLIFDTDVDRSSAVDENGREISRNGIVAMAAALIAPDHPGTTVVTDSITSDQLHIFLENDLGLRHFRYKRGYRNVINKAIELNDSGTDCMLAIETSGHAAYKDNYFLDDGAFLAVRIVIKTALLKAEGKAISSVTAGLKDPVEAREYRLPIHADDFQSAGAEILDGVKEWASGRDEETDVSYCDGDIDDISAEIQSGSCDASINGTAFDPGNIHFSVVEPNYEGVRVNFRGAVNGWFLIRKSLHDPIIPINIECSEKGGCSKIAAVLAAYLSRFEALDTSKLTQ